MTTYKEIFGKQIKQLSTDPTDAGAEGQVWYNTTSGTFKSVVAAGAWSSASPTINFTNSGGGAGTQTAGLIFAGRNPIAPAFVSTTEEYNGSGWASGGAINTARAYIAGFGLQTAAVGAGGRTDAPGTNTTATEEYNGSAWTTVNAMGSARRMQNAGVGILTAGLGVGPSATEEYDGTNWTAGGALNTTRAYLSGFGTQTAAAAAGGNLPPGTYSNAVEEYNGTSWTTVTVLPAIRQSAGAAGTQTQGIIFGGELPGATATAFTYDGTNWTTTGSMGTAGFSGEPAGSGTAALAANFHAPPGVNRNTEEYNFTANTITAGAWSAGDNIPTATTSFGGAGTRDATLVFGGYVGGPGVTGYVATTFEYDGASWTGGGALPVVRNSPINFGTQTAAVAFAGNNQPPSGGVYLNSGDHYDGSSWTATPNNYPTTISNAGSVGTQTAGLAFAGYTGTALTNATNEYNGTSWTGTGNYPVSISGMGVAGIQTSALSFGGTNNGSPFPASGQTTTAEYNGSSWTALTGLPGGRIYPQGAGNANADNARSIGGRNTSGSSITETLIHDGTAWATQPSLAAARQSATAGGVCSTSAAATIISGSPLPSSTEEFTGETTAVNVKTLTSS